ncbi:MAG TPA: aldose epimerase family protein [Bauldia sp.]|nr:aldose epimerase family protein [Bauldia sp.]
MAARVFGQLPEGGTVHEVTLAAGDLTIAVIALGAIIRDVRLAGFDHPLVLGFDDPASYLQHSPFFGAVCGRYGGRIARGRFTLDGRTHQLSLNENGRTHLHGGNVGFSRRLWEIVDARSDSVALRLVSPDGEEGYPGTLTVEVRYTLEAPATIRMEVTAITDAPTVVNLLQHSYFNLDDSSDILDHRVQIFAGAYTPTDADLIPTGEILTVAGSNFDFRTPRPVRQMRGAERIVYDKNFVVDRRRAASPRPMARLTSPKNGLSLAIESTEPGLQFYDGSYIDVPVPSLGGRSYHANAGVCLEPQLFGDAPNHQSFPSSVLRPGETYRQVSTFAFVRT